MNDERPAREPGGQTARTRNEAAHAEHGGRTTTQDDEQRLDQRQPKLERRNDQRDEAFSTQPLDADPFDVDTGVRYDPGLQPAVRAEPDDILFMRFECSRNGECRVNVPARAARHYEYRAPAHRCFFLRLRLTGLASTVSS